jgi:cell wall-associated NlpC family hydrolase
LDTGENNTLRFFFFKEGEVMKDIKTKAGDTKPKVMNVTARIPSRAKVVLLNSNNKAKEEAARDVKDTPENYAVEHVMDGNNKVIQGSSKVVINRIRRLFHKNKRSRLSRDYTKESEKSSLSGCEFSGTETNTDITINKYEIAKNNESSGYLKNSHSARSAAQHVKIGKGTKITSASQIQHGTIKTVNKGVKSANRTLKASAKSVKSVQQAVKVTVKTTKVTAKATQITVKTTAKGVKLAAKAVVAAVKAIGLAVKGLAAAIAAGGWVVLIITIVISALLLILNSAFGIFYSNEDTGTDLSMSQVVTDINAEYSAYIDHKIAEASAGHKNITVIYTGDMDGDSESVNNWVDVLGVYAVKTTMAGTDAMDVATITGEKKKIIKDLFWDMNPVSVQVKTTKEEITVIDEEGNEKMEIIEKTTAYVNVSSEDYGGGAQKYGFNEQQNKMLEELMAAQNYPLFAQLTGVDCYGGLTPEELENINRNLPVGDKGADIVRCALTRLGDPYSKSKRGQGRYVDCSYFARWAYQKAGVTNFTAGTAAEQARYCVNHDVIIPKAQLQPGDLIFWKKNGCMCAGDHCGRYRNIHHVGIYIGGNKVIEASSSKGRVVIRELWGEAGGKWEIVFYARAHIL